MGGQPAIRRGYSQWIYPDKLFYCGMAEKSAVVLVPADFPVELKQLEGVQWFMDSNDPLGTTRFASAPDLARALKVSRIAVVTGTKSHAMSTDSILQRDQYKFASKRSGL